MPVYEQRPGSKNLMYVHPKNGKFVVKNSDNEEVEYQTIEGTLELIDVEFDAGNPAYKIAPHDAFIMHIADAETLYRIKINAERNFSLSCASVLGDIQKGDLIRATAKPGDDNTVTFCNFVKQDENGQWVRPKIDEDFKGLSKSEKVDYLKTLVKGHSAKKISREE